MRLKYILMPLFGKQFSRGQDNAINAGLNYGYSILLSAFNREIVSQGYMTQLGLFHDNQFNEFNLSSDLMEPFRILVDQYVVKMKKSEFTNTQKYDLIQTLNTPVTIDGKSQLVLNAIKIYVKSIFKAINEENTDLIKGYRNELSFYENNSDV